MAWAGGRRTTFRLRPVHHRRRDDGLAPGELDEVLRQTVVLRVDTGHRVRHPDAAEHAEGGAEHRDERDQLGVVKPGREVRVAQGLERGDLLALRGHQAREDHVQKERRDTEEDRRHDDGIGLELTDLVGQEAIGHLVLAQESAEPAVAPQLAIEGDEDLRLRGAGLEPRGDVVEGSLHVAGGLELTARGPQDAEVLVVGHQVAGPDLVDELRREPDSDDRKGLLPSLDHGGHAVARAKAVGGGESLADDDFAVRARGDRSSGADVEAVESGRSAARNRNEPRRDGFRESGHLEGGVGHHPRLHLCHAGNRGEAPRHRLRRTPQGGEHVGEAIALVVVLLRAHDRSPHRHRAHERGHAAGDEQDDGEQLALQVAKVAQELAIERAHHASSAAPTRRAL